MKALVVLSGGMDSAVALAVAKTQNSSVETITFNYGSKHNDRENIAATKISEFYRVKNTLVRLPFINELFKSDLLKSGNKIPEGHYEDPSMKRTVVPFRNGIMLSIAAGFAESIEAKFLYLGNHAGDHAIYPDCRSKFSIPMGKAIKYGTYAQIKLERPFEVRTKTDIVNIGLNLDVPFALTYSCYNGREKHCGKCGTCVERREAFKNSHVFDPTEYE